MKTVTIRQGAENYATTASDGMHQWMIDEPREKGGGDKGPDPVAMLLASLGSCTAITLRMYAQRKGWVVQEIHITMEMTEATLGAEKNVTFRRTITVAGKLDEGQLQRLQQIAKACPVSRMLEGQISIETNIRREENVL